MKLSEFLSDRMGVLAIRIFFAAAAALFLLVMGTQGGVLVILGIGWGVLFFGTQGAEFLRCRADLQELEGVLDTLDKKYLFAECAPKCRAAYGRRMMDLCRRAGRAMTGAVSDAEAKNQEYREYIESWVHEVKAPITAAGLICRNMGQGPWQEAVPRENKQNAVIKARRKLSLELAKIEAHVERVLFYARAGGTEKDFLIRQASLAEMVAQALGQYRVLLMEGSIRVETVDLEQTVFTDSKWVVFLLGQLLQNAARYRGENPVVTIAAKPLGKQVQLTVEDNGIGIPAHELPRVFERGFTGSNGRARGGSTGMGLYLCRKLAKNLGMEIRIASKVGVGTQVAMVFPAKGMEKIGN